MEPVLPADLEEHTLPATPKTPPALPPKSGKPARLPAWIIALLGVVALASLAVIALLVMRSSGMLGPLKPYVNPMPTDTPALTITPVPTRSPLPTETAIPTPTPGIGSTWIRPADAMMMVYVPPGEFRMGDTADQALAECQKSKNYCERDWFSDEEPPHTVRLDAYWIDQTEVTNAMYTQCVSDGDCQPPYSLRSNTRDNYYGISQYADYPVIYVDWNRAEAYCRWARARLPTEAEWEKAARGTDGRTYPWGNEVPACSQANYFNCIADTAAVGSYLSGASPYGALDMAGNVWEWVNDWYGDTYYKDSPESNPQGPSSGSYRVLRGGSWFNNDYYLRSALRNMDGPAGIHDKVGFRCSRSQ
jgi:formylglycine-generating enzyme required for sulfatase activity